MLDQAPITLQDRLRQTNLREFVSKAVYQKGESLYRNGSVACIDAKASFLSFEVEDEESYFVTFELDGWDILSDCDCPDFADWGMCEHVVAAQLYAKSKELRGKRSKPSQSYLDQHRVQVSAEFDDVLAFDFIPPDELEEDLGWYLFFSLQEKRGHKGYTIVPQRLDAIHIMEALQIDQLESVDLDRTLETNQDLKKHLMSASDLSGANSCINFSALKIGRLQGMLREPLGQLLDALSWYKATIYWGTSLNPLGAPLRFEPAKTAFRLNLAANQRGLIFDPILLCGQDEIPFKGKAVEKLDPNAMWVMQDDRLLRLPANLDPVLIRKIESLATSVILRDEEDYFFDRHFPAIASAFDIGGARSAQEAEVDEAPLKQLFLSEYDQQLVIYPYFSYRGFSLSWHSGNSNFAWRLRRKNPADPTDIELIQLQRDLVWEKGVVKSLSTAKFGLKKGSSEDGENFFVLRSRVNPLEFLHTHLPKLVEAGFEIFGEEHLEQIQVNRAVPTISVEVTSDIDWFDTKLLIKFGDATLEVNEFRLALKSKKPYVELSDGSIGQIPDEWFERFRRFFSLSYSTEGEFRFSHGQIPLLELLLDEVDEAWVDDFYAGAVDRLKSFTHIEEKRVAPNFQGELRDYQQAGFDWLHFLYDFGCNGILADDMGLGKTVQVLAFLQSLRYAGKNTGADLIVMPRSLLVNWEREAAKFTPDLNVLIYYGSKRKRWIEDLDRYDLVLTTYGTVLKDADDLADYRFQYIILDESQAIKNPTAKISKSIRALQSDRRLAMSGTPVENNTLELWSQFAFLSPGFLGSLTSFKESFQRPIEKENHAVAAAILRDLVYPFILRRTKTQVATELPPRTDQTIFVEMEPAQRKAYNRLRDEYRASIMGLIDEKGMEGSQMHVLEGLLRLRQMCNHPALVDPHFRGDACKMRFLLDTLETLYSEGHKALIFSQFVGMLTLVREVLDDAGLPYAYLDGKMQDRQAEVDRFQEDHDLPFFLISLKAGGVGLNLTAADHVIHLDPWWNPAVEAQATDRAYRIGQERPVFVNKLITKDTIEEKILALQAQKQALADKIITTEGGFFKQLSVGDIENLFS